MNNENDFEVMNWWNATVQTARAQLTGAAGDCNLRRDAPRRARGNDSRESPPQSARAAGRLPLEQRRPPTHNPRPGRADYGSPARPLDQCPPVQVLLEAARCSAGPLRNRPIIRRLVSHPQSAVFRTALHRFRNQEAPFKAFQSAITRRNFSFFFTQRAIRVLFTGSLFLSYFSAQGAHNDTRPERRPKRRCANETERLIQSERV